MNEETKIKNKVIKALKERFDGIWIWKTCDMYRAGIPDLLCIYKGFVFFIELKTPTGKLSKIQEVTIEEIISSGVQVYVINSVGQVENIEL